MKVFTKRATSQRERMTIMTNVNIKFARLHNDTIIPSKRSEDAGLDIYARFDGSHMIIPPHTTAMIPTSLVSACDEGYYFQLFERGSTGSRGMAQRCGVIDSGYRGEWFVPITNTNPKPLIITKFPDDYIDIDTVIVYPYSKAICQAVVLPVPKLTIEEIDYEDIMKIESLRGSGSLGSSKK